MRHLDRYFQTAFRGESGTSKKNLMQMAQVYKGYDFKKYDYGMIGN